MTTDIISRQEEITSKFLKALDNHLNDVANERADTMKEINEIAEQLHIHPTHLSNKVRQFTGKSAEDLK